VDVFGLSETGPISRDFGTKDQIRRSAFSISNNIAEGFEYDNNKDFIKFLRFAKGSAGELRSQLFVPKETELLDAIFYEQKKDELLGLSRQIKAFIEYLRKFEQDKQKTAPTKT
jgi:four helix bundle protein